MPFGGEVNTEEVRKVVHRKLVIVTPCSLILSFKVCSDGERQGQRTLNSYLINQITAAIRHNENDLRRVSRMWASSHLKTRNLQYSTSP